MRATTKGELPEPHATAPLNDPDNVGRFVWHSWNGNTASPAKIIRVSRAHVTIDDHSAAGLTLKVDADPCEAFHSGRWSSSVRTAVRASELAHRGELRRRVDATFRLSWGQDWTTDQLERLVAWLEAEGLAKP